MLLFPGLLNWIYVPFRRRQYGTGKRSSGIRKLGDKSSPAPSSWEALPLGRLISTTAAGTLVKRGVPLATISCQAQGRSDVLLGSDARKWVKVSAGLSVPFLVTCGAGLHTRGLRLRIAGPVGGPGPTLRCWAESRAARLPVRHSASCHRNLWLFLQPASDRTKTAAAPRPRSLSHLPAACKQEFIPIVQKEEQKLERVCERLTSEHGGRWRDSGPHGSSSKAVLLHLAEGSHTPASGTSRPHPEPGPETHWDHSWGASPL